MDLINWRKKMERLTGSDRPEPRYIVWHGPSDMTTHNMLADALRVVSTGKGGVIYERLASREADAAAAGGDDG